MSANDNCAASALVAYLKEKGKTISCAESCTAGLVADSVVQINGASAVFAGGVVCYQNRIKEEVLGIPSAVIETHTAVSAEVAQAMATNCKALFKTDYAVSVTGVAGPKSEFDDAPVGTVYIGVCTDKICKSVRFLFEGDRTQIRQSAALAAISQLFCEVSQEA